MAPAHQRLGGGDPAAGERHFRLIEQEELALLDGSLDAGRREPGLLPPVGLQHQFEFGRREGLGDGRGHVEAARQTHAARRVHHALAGAAHEDDAGGAAVGGELRQQLEAIDHRHLQVEHDVRRRPGANALEEVVGCRHDERLVADARRDARHHRADGRVVVDHEQPMVRRGVLLAHVMGPGRPAVVRRLHSIGPTTPRRDVERPGVAARWHERGPLLPRGPPAV